MSRFAALAVLASIPMLLLGHAHAQHLSPEQLDRLSQTRQSEIGSRSWGPPPSGGKAAAQATRPVPFPVRCMSPAHNFEPLYAEPRASSRQIGVAAPQIAVTDQVHDGWRQVLRHGTTFAWIPAVDVLAYRPLVADHPTGCEVSGESADGTVLFTHPDR